MSTIKWISLDIPDNTLPDYYNYMDYKKYSAVCINNKRFTVYAKSLAEAKQKVIALSYSPIKEIYRI
jgi:hypothetical protein